MSRTAATALAALAFVLLCGCDRPVPKMSDEEMRRLRAEMRGATPQCLEKIRLGGLEAMPARVDECFEMMPARRWRGFWRLGLEYSRFCPEPAVICSPDMPEPSIWLEPDPALLPGTREMPDALYRIDFVGRRTLYPGSFGNGLWPHDIVVDKLISLERVDRPTP